MRPSGEYDQVIETNPEDAEALADRGVAKHYLADQAGACSDWKLASQKGSDKAKGYLLKYCE